MIKYLMLVALVAALSKTTWAIDIGCDFYQVVIAGPTYYVFNPEYPRSYNRARSCRWYVRSATKVRLRCQISLLASTNCVRDRLSVSPNGDLQLADAHNYCGSGSFDITSTGNYLNIVLTTFAGTPGGRFLCTLQTAAITVPTCNCGWKKQTKIVGGNATGVNEYPMMAGVVDTVQRFMYCGATIISTKYLLSAAHCRPPTIPIDKLAVLVGDHDISTGTDTTASSLHPVSAFISHPSFDSGTLANDIAIITVTDTIVFTMDVGPACLPFHYAATTFAGAKVDVLGWGTIGFGEARSDVLQKVQLDVTQFSTCQQAYPNATNSQLCTYTPGKDTCGFDSGGPLLWQDSDTMRLVSVGVISSGVGCAGATPGLNTRVGAYMNWILSVTPDANYCRVD